MYKRQTTLANYSFKRLKTYAEVNNETTLVNTLTAETEKQASQHTKTTEKLELKTSPKHQTKHKQTAIKLEGEKNQENNLGLYSSERKLERKRKNLEGMLETLDFYELFDDILEV